MRLLEGLTRAVVAGAPYSLYLLLNLLLHVVAIALRLQLRYTGVGPVLAEGLVSGQNSIHGCRATVVDEYVLYLLVE